MYTQKHKKAKLENRDTPHIYTPFTKFRALKLYYMIALLIIYILSYMIVGLKNKIYI